MRVWCLLMIVVWLAAADEVYQAPTPEPTPVETLILEMINRCRADPKAESLRMAPAGADPRLPSATAIDFAMFRDEMAKIPTAPPLVFDLRLLDAARKHSWYMIAHGLGHDEDPTLPRFTGRTPGDRVKAAGFSGGGYGENAYRDAPDAWGSQLGFIVDWGPGGAGGMQAGRGHRTNICNPMFRLIGPSAVAHGEKFSVTHNLGGAAVRYAGGVTFVDRDGDAFYDLVEGRRGVTIAVGAKSITSWSSGAYSLEIPASACTMTLKAGGVSITRAIAAGSANVKIDWIIPAEQEQAVADRLIAAVDSSKDLTAPAGRKSLVALMLGADGLILDQARSERIATLTGALASELAADREAVRATLDDAKAFPAAVAEHAKPWKGTAAAQWFTDATASVRAAAALAALPPDATPTRVRGLAKELRALVDGTVTSEFKARIAGLAGKAEARLPPGR